MALPTLESYAAQARRHLRLMAVGLVLGTIGGLAFLQLQPSTYTATTEVLLGRVPSHIRTDPAAPDSRLVTIDTDAIVVRSRQVVREVAEATGLLRAQAQRQLTVDAEPLTPVLHVSFTDARSATAEIGADVAAQTLLEVRSTKLYSRRAQEARQLERKLRRLTDQIELLRVSGQPYNAPLASLQRQLESQYDLAHERVAVRTDGGHVLVNAEAPSEPSRVNPEVPVASGAMLGLLAGLGVGLLWDLRRHPHAFSSDGDASS